MSKETPRTISVVKLELERLTNTFWICNSPKVQAAINEFRRENKAKVESLRNELELLRTGRKPSKRWPQNVPQNVREACERFWSGTTEFATFRIHEWNEKAVWTSYPAGRVGQAVS